MKNPYKWGNNKGEIGPPIVWSDNPYTWDDVYFIRAVVNGNGLEYLKKHPKEKKKFIKLLCKVQGKEYVETKEIDKVEIFIKDIQLVAKEVAGINLKIDI